MWAEYGPKVDWQDNLPDMLSSDEEEVHSGFICDGCEG